MSVRPQFDIRIKGDPRFFVPLSDSQIMREYYYDTEYKFNGEDYLHFAGEPKYSLESYAEKKLKIKKFDVNNITEENMSDLLHMTWQEKTRIFNCEIEAFCVEEDGYDIEHLRYKNGEELLRKRYKLTDVVDQKILIENNIVFDEESEEDPFECDDIECIIRFDEAFSLGTDDESVKQGSLKFANITFDRYRNIMSLKYSNLI